MSIPVLCITKVPNSVTGVNWEKTIHASEEIFGYCQVHDLHQSQINKTALQLYTDETLMTESVKFFVQVIMLNGVTMFYLSSPAGNKTHKFIGRAPEQRSGRSLLFEELSKRNILTLADFCA